MPLGNNFDWSGAAQYLDLDPSWYEDDSQLREDIQSKWDKATPAQRRNFSKNLSQQPRQPARPVQQVTPMYNDHGDSFSYGGFNSAMIGAAGQNSALQGMANDVMQAFANENESRVAQAREAARMEHERWKMMQQMDLARMKLQNDSANQIRALRMRSAMESPTRSRTIRQDPNTGEFRWMEDWEL